MSYDRRRVELIKCGCTEGIDEFGELRGYPKVTVHCENRDGKMRCEICGRIKQD